MPKTIAITPSWYWPEAVDRVAGIPPFGIHEICLARHARDKPDHPALITDDATISFAELATRVRQASQQLAAKIADAGSLVMDGERSVDSIACLMGAFSLGLCARIVETEGPGAIAGRLDLSSLPPAGGIAEGPDIFETGNVHDVAVAIKGHGGIARHTHRSLLAGAISMATFLQPAPDSAWLHTCSLDRWEGLLSLLLPLYLGEAVVLPSNTEGEGFADAIERHRPGYAIVDLSLAATATRDAKRSVKKARDILNSVLLSTPGLFDPGDRERVGKSFRCPALTFYGLAETGAIFASHPQWYMNESIGIPVTNAHVVPADPRNGSPIQTLWELVESAEVTVKGPGLMAGYENRNDLDYLTDGRFRTGVIASSDANGMIYILPD